MGNLTATLCSPPFGQSVSGDTKLAGVQVLLLASWAGSLDSRPTGEESTGGLGVRVLTNDELIQRSARDPDQFVMSVVGYEKSVLVDGATRLSELLYWFAGA